MTISSRSFSIKDFDHYDIKSPKYLYHCAVSGMLRIDNPNAKRVTRFIGNSKIAQGVKIENILKTE